MATEMASRKGKRECPELPPDTLRLIWASLPIKSRVRARAVCAAWSSALPDKIEPYPWLLRLPPTPAAAGHGDTAASTPTVFFPSTGISAGFELPFHHPGTRCVGTHDGWIAAVDVDLGVKILDPLSGAHVDLPPLTACPGVGFGRGRASKKLHEQIEYKQWPTAVTEFFPVDTFLDYVLVKIAFSTPGADDPAGEVGAFAVAVFWDRLVYTAAVLGEWRQLMTLNAGTRCHPERIIDVVHGGGGRFFGLAAIDETYLSPTAQYHFQVFDLGAGGDIVEANNLPVASLHPRQVLRRHKFPSGDVFCARLFLLDGTPHVVLRWWDVLARADEMAVFFSDPGDPLGWRVAGDLHGRALLVGNGCAAAVHVPGGAIGGDRVYFASKVGRFARESNRRLTGVGTFDVKSGSLEMVWKDGAGDPLETGRAPTWLAPPSYFR
uniref:KIB1-4 beta-propeller domain-containing protein n=1 Tax=Oryza punctata TaxID=4537 RepID=A0A0E0LJY8_ORYPU